jgi:hypothetical protein
MLLASALTHSWGRLSPEHFDMPAGIVAALTMWHGVQQLVTMLEVMLKADSDSANKTMGDMSTFMTVVPGAMTFLIATWWFGYRNDTIPLNE